MREWFEEVTKSQLGHIEHLTMTYELASMVIRENIPGDFVECGVYAGAQCAAMAKALQYHGVTSRRVHLFDSFQGLPPAAPVDEEIYAAWGDKATDPKAVCSLVRVQNNMRNWGIPNSLLVYWPGWFNETVPEAVSERAQEFRIKQIAMLRLDGDLYSSTKVCMDHLYPLCVRGACVIVDDWNLTGTRKAVNEMVMPAPIYWRTPTK